MAADDPDTMRIECTDCGFSRTVRSDDDELPAAVVREHGQEKGHTLEVHRADESDS